MEDNKIVIYRVLIDVRRYKIYLIVYVYNNFFFESFFLCVIVSTDDLGTDTKTDTTPWFSEKFYIIEILQFIIYNIYIRGFT